jgi:hypothetical protein
MKNIINIILSVIAVISFWSCGKDNPVTTTPTDPNLLYSASEVTCDFKDSLRYNDTTFYFADSMKYKYAGTRTFTKLKVIFDLDYSVNPSTMMFYNLDLIHTDTANTYGDSLISNWNVGFNTGNNIVVYNLKYPTNYDFYFRLYLTLWGNPFHSDFISFKNIKIYKLD